TTFIALGQTFMTAYHSDPRRGATTQDTIFVDSTFSSSGGPASGSGVVLLGTISGSQATLSLIAGTEGATSYARTGDGATVVVTRRDDRRLFRVPMAGGTAVAVATVTPSTTAQLVGVSCRAATCLVAVDPITLFYGGPQGETGSGPTYPSISPGPRELRSVALVGGAVQQVWTSGTAGPIVATPRFSPGSSDLVVQVGGVWGHLQTFSDRGSNLHLLHGLVP
ncbi:MAG: hypothetical protein ABUL71_01645, partial [Gemmatimonadota bacterium]